jgi:hypothetical protein
MTCQSRGPAGVGRGIGHGRFVEIGEQLDVHPETPRNWFKQFRIDAGDVVRTGVDRLPE